MTLFRWKRRGVSGFTYPISHSTILTNNSIQRLSYRNDSRDLHTWDKNNFYQINRASNEKLLRKSWRNYTVYQFVVDFETSDVIFNFSLFKAHTLFINRKSIKFQVKKYQTTSFVLNLMTNIIFSNVRDSVRFIQYDLIRETIICKQLMEWPPFSENRPTKNRLEFDRFWNANF